MLTQNESLKLTEYVTREIKMNAINFFSNHRKTGNDLQKVLENESFSKAGRLANCVSISRNFLYISLLFHPLICFAMLEEDQEYFSEFHSRLKNSHTTWEWDEKISETYLSRIAAQSPFPSQIVNSAEDEVLEIIIKRDGEKFIEEPGRRGVFKKDDLEVTLNPIPILGDEPSSSQSNPRKPQISIRANYQSKEIFSNLLLYTEEGKSTPFILPFNDYNSALRHIRSGYWRKKTTAMADLTLPSEFRNGPKLEVEIVHTQKYPLAVTGMAISYNKKSHKTVIFFDLINPFDSNESSKYFSPYPCDANKYVVHEKKEVIDLPCYRIADGRIFRHSYKETVYKIFPSHEERKKWVFSEHKFMKLSGNPIHSSVPIEYKETFPVKNEKNSSLDERQRFEISEDTSSSMFNTYFKDWKRDANKRNFKTLDCAYLYSDGCGNFSGSPLYQEEWQDIDDAFHAIKYFYTTPALRFADEVRFDPNTRAWKKGFYEIARASKGRKTWKPVEDSRNIEYITEFDSALFSADSQFILNNNMQKSPIVGLVELLLNGKGSRRDLPISYFDNFNKFTKITVLNISNINLFNGHLWSKGWAYILEGISNSKNLAKLDLSSNEFTKGDLVPLENCLGKLPSLIELRIQAVTKLPLRHFGKLFKCLPKATQLQTLHLDNLPGEISYRNYLKAPVLLAIEANNPSLDELLEGAAKALVSLPNLTSLTLYEKQQNEMYHFNKNEAFQKIIENQSRNNGKNNLRISR